MFSPKKTVKVVGIVCNVKTNPNDESQGEFDEPETIEALSKAIEKANFKPIVINANDNLAQKLIETKPDFVFNIAEGISGRSREAQAPAIMEYLNIPFVGSDASTLSLALDKDLTKRLLSTFGVASPKAHIITAPAKLLPADIEFPVIVKPNAEGSSKGIHINCVANNVSELREVIDGFEDGIELIVEQYVDGREFTVGLLGNGKDVKVFEPMEILFKNMPSDKKVYSYEVKKHFREHIAYDCPPKMDGALCEKLKSDAKIVFEALHCRDFARVDFRMGNNNKIYFIEANPLPGLAPEYSDYPMLAGFCGVDYDTLVGAILFAALSRSGLQRD